MSVAISKRIKYLRKLRLVFVTVRPWSWSDSGNRAKFLSQDPHTDKGVCVCIVQFVYGQYARLAEQHIRYKNRLRLDCGIAAKALKFLLLFFFSCEYDFCTYPTDKNGRNC